MSTRFFISLLFLLPVWGYAQKTGLIRISQVPYPLTFGNNQPVAFSQFPGGFAISSKGNTDIYRAADYSYDYFSAPLLSFRPDPVFVLSAKISLNFDKKWDAGGIVLVADSLHYIKFAFEKDYTLRHRVVSVVTNPYSDDCNSMEVSGNAVYFKMAKSGDMVLLYESTDGKSWYLVRELNFPFSRLRVGFLSQSPVGKGTRVTYSDVAYRTKKITDPYNP